LASIDKAMRMKPVPPEALYAIGASLNQVEYLWRYEKSAAYLECLVRDYPAKETYLRQLQAAYAAARNYLAALLTVERAQAQGLLNTPKDNEMRVSLLYNLERFADAAALMEKGLGDGSIPDTQRNWDTLAYCYTILKQEDKLIAALKRASELHDWSSVDLQLAQIYYRKQQFDDTIVSLETAIQKGNLKDPLSTYIFLAQVAMLRKDFPKAKAALDDAAALNSQDTAQITKLDSVRRYYDQMLEIEQKNAEREAKKKQKK
jgi:tetratricopeptide (TPR) repeat protein